VYQEQARRPEGASLPPEVRSGRRARSHGPRAAGTDRRGSTRPWGRRPMAGKERAVQDMPSHSIYQM
jgi:hypothetical protein